MATETIRMFDVTMREWRTVTVDVPAERPARRARTARQTARRVGQPANRDGLSNGTPPGLPYLADTAYAPNTGFADMRTYIPEQTIKTHRKPTVMPAGNAGDPSGRARWVDLH